VPAQRAPHRKTAQAVATERHQRPQNKQRGEDQRQPQLPVRPRRSATVGRRAEVERVELDRAVDALEEAQPGLERQLPEAPDTEPIVTAIVTAARSQIGIRSRPPR
jgi:hypothetical protein